MPRECSDEIRGDELSLLSAVDDLDLDPRLLIDLLYQLHPILCISHRRGSTGSEGFYLVDLHQFMVGLHEADELLGLLLRDTPIDEGILPEAEGYTYELYLG